MATLNLSLGAGLERPSRQELTPDREVFLPIRVRHVPEGCFFISYENPG